jgi:hypothetical protein
MTDRYDQSPTQDHLIHAISISRKWSINNLYGYALDHFRRQFFARKIHPAVALGVARRFGIPELIDPAVRLLARPDIPLSSWSTDPHIICQTTVTEVGIIGRMKEKVLLARFALCGIPPVTHSAMCYDKHRIACSASWRDFWVSSVVPKLLNLENEVQNRLWCIRTDCVAKAQVPGMLDKCLEWTVGDVIENTGWQAETRIPDGAISLLIVPEHPMLDPTLAGGMIS